MPVMNQDCHNKIMGKNNQITETTANTHANAYAQAPPALSIFHPTNKFFYTANRTAIPLLYNTIIHLSYHQPNINVIHPHTNNQFNTSPYNPNGNDFITTTVNYHINPYKSQNYYNNNNNAVEKQSKLAPEQKEPNQEQPTQTPSPILYQYPQKTTIMILLPKLPTTSTKPTSPTNRTNNAATYRNNEPDQPTNAPFHKTGIPSNQQKEPGGQKSI